MKSTHVKIDESAARSFSLIGENKLIFHRWKILHLTKNKRSPTSGSKKSNSGAHVYKAVSKFLKLENLERKILVMCAWEWR